MDQNHLSKCIDGPVGEERPLGPVEIVNLAALLALAILGVGALACLILSLEVAS